MRQHLPLRQQFLCGVAAVTIITAINGPVLGADQRPVLKAGPIAAPVFNWTGGYIGGIGSAGMFGTDMSDQWCFTACDAPDMRKWGGALGGTLGYNIQAGSLVYGIEGDVSAAWFENERLITDGTYLMTHHSEWNWYATIRGRMGLAVDRTLAYVTGGVAFVGTKYSNWYSPFGDDEGFRRDDTQVGLAAGVGIEHAFGNNWGLKAEYLFIGLPDVSADYSGPTASGANPGGDIITWRSDAHLFRLGLNYRLGDFGKGPMVAGLSAMAADQRLISKTGRVPAPVFNWTGGYIGLVGSVGMFGTDMSDQGCDTACDAPDMSKWGGALGGTLGYNLQAGSLVYGIEGDVSAAWFEAEKSPSVSGSYALTHRSEWNWYATIRGRIGLAFDRTLAYVTGGVAFVGADYLNWYNLFGGSPADEGFRRDGTQVGLAAGAGIEHAFGNNWSLKAEYLYIGLPDLSALYGGSTSLNSSAGDPDAIMTWRSDAHLVRLGLNYRPVSNAGPVAYAGPAVNWSGGYIGVVGSGGMFGTDMSDLQPGACVVACDAPDMRKWGGALGGTLGYNIQAGSLVYGIEGDVSAAWFENEKVVTDGTYVLTHRSEWDWYGTVRGRLGLAVDRTLAYVTGGVAFVGTKYSNWYTVSGSGLPSDEGFRRDGTQVGLAAGAGIEHAFGNNWSFKAEYLYIGLPDVLSGLYGGPTSGSGGNPDELVDWRSDAHVVRLGLNYRLGDFGKGPMVAKY